MATLKTYSRKLEQALFTFGIEFLSCDKDEDNMTYWTYAKNDQTEMLFRMFKDANEKRRKAGW